MKRLKANVKICLERRGYKVGKCEETEEYGFIIPFVNGEKEGKVFYCDKNKMNQDDLSKIFREFIDQDYHIIVLYKDITPPAYNSFKDHISKYLPDAELIDIGKFYQDIMSHPWVSEYEPLTEKEKQNLVKVYKTDEKLFPKMLTTDPVSILMGFKDGNMVRCKCYYNFTQKCIDKEMPPAITYYLVTSDNS